uniref:Uncharacterized protein n=1 Tax=Tanacetum cinerariifolium TaxID=118510 RepID=A0A699GKK5_TANCI|nr:hypothetical protein [Tanacetum cinerariifolium]
MTNRWRFIHGPLDDDLYMLNLLSKNINPIASQQAALDNSLVAPEKRLKIERCNARIAFTKPQNEETYQVILEALKLSPFYPAFQIIVKVLEIYMHQFWNTIKKIGKTDAYNFKLDKKKCRVDIEIYGAVIPIGMINDDIKLSKAYNTYLDYATRKVPPKKSRKFKKPASPKLKTVLASPKEPTQNGQRAAKKATTTPRTSVVIKDTHDKYVSKNKSPPKIGRGKGIKLLSDAALLEEAQMKKAFKKRTGEKPGVPNMSKDYSTDSKVESCGDSENESDDLNLLSKNINPIASQQAALDNSLVAPEKRLKIERCNARIAFTKPQNEETYQVILEALKLSPFYPAFQIIVKVLEIYMHQFWNTIKKIGKTDAYNFKLDKKKCRVDIEIYGAVIPIGMINDDIKLSKAYNTYLDYATRKVPPKKSRKFKKPASPKLKTVLASPKEPTQNGQRAAKKATTTPRTSVVIKDTPDKYVSKNKSPPKIGRGKGIKLLSDAALLEEAQMKKAFKKSKRQTHNLQASSSSEGANFESEVLDEQTDKPKDTNEGTGEKPGVPNMSKDYSTDSKVESCGDSENESDDVNDEDDDDDSGNDDNGSNDAEDSEHRDLDDDENPSFILKDFQEEEQYAEFVLTL